jgi:F-type H+-transporting ATPase subunit c
MAVVPAGVAEKTPNKKETNMLLPILAEMTGSIHIGLAALGAAIGVGLIGMGASSAVGRNPGAATPILVQAILAIAFAEAIVFYALYLAPK